MGKKNYKKSVGIVLPFYNEEKNLKILIPRILKTLRKTKNLFKLYLVDDLSTDGGYQFCKKIAKKNKFIYVYKLKKKGRQTGAIKMAIKKIDTEYIIVMDTDLQDDPKYLVNFISKVNQGYDLVVGNRITRKAPLVLILATKIYDIILELIFKKGIKTYRSPYVAFKSTLLKNLPWFHNDHRYLVPIAIHKGATKCTSLDYMLKDRLNGTTNYNARLKVISGFFEVIIFLFRLVLRSYK